MKYVQESAFVSVLETASEMELELTAAELDVAVAEELFAVAALDVAVAEELFAVAALDVAVAEELFAVAALEELTSAAVNIGSQSESWFARATLYMPSVVAFFVRNMTPRESVMSRS